MATPESARAETLTMLARHPEINVLISFNEAVSVGAAQAVSDSNRADDLWMVAFDSNITTVDALPFCFLLVLFLNVCQIAHVQTLDFGKLSGYVYFSGVIVFCFYSLIHLKRCLPFAQYRYDAIYFILLILCSAWGGDTAAYFAGRAFGKHKLAPIVSPHKTVEGAIGGIFGSVLAGVVLTLVYSFLSASHNVITIQVQPRHYAILVVMGAIASVLGILGDLFASSVKRQVGIKDYGTIFPGHGGILDRFDSVMFIAPFVSIAVRYFFYVL